MSKTDRNMEDSPPRETMRSRQINCWKARENQGVSKEHAINRRARGLKFELSFAFHWKSDVGFWVQTETLLELWKFQRSKVSEIQNQKTRKPEAARPQRLHRQRVLRPGDRRLRKARNQELKLEVLTICKAYIREYPHYFFGFNGIRWGLG